MAEDEQKLWVKGAIILTVLIVVFISIFLIYVFNQKNYEPNSIEEAGPVFANILLAVMILFSTWISLYFSARISEKSAQANRRFIIIFSGAVSNVVIFCLFYYGIGIFIMDKYTNGLVYIIIGMLFLFCTFATSIAYALKVPFVTNSILIAQNDRDSPSSSQRHHFVAILCAVLSCILGFLLFGSWFTQEGLAAYLAVLYILLFTALSGCVGIIIENVFRNFFSPESAQQ